MPYRLRYQMEWNHGLSCAVLRVYAPALMDLYRRRAVERGVHGARTGLVTVVQRAGSGGKDPARSSCDAPLPGVLTP